MEKYAGEGWYDGGEVAEISIKPAEIPILWFLVKRVAKRLEYKYGDDSWHEKPMVIVKGVAIASFFVQVP